MRPPPSPPTALANVAFLAGHWRGGNADVTIEEIWMEPQAGLAQGMVRLIRNGEIGTIELLLASAEDDRVVLRYNHFNPNYTTWETDGPIALTLTEASASRLVFTNLESPQRHALEMGYEADGADALTSWVRPIGGENDRSLFIVDFQRIA